MTSQTADRALTVTHTDDDDRGVVILVHGTFAADASDDGDAWWQRDSAAYKALKRRLPEGARLPERGEVFHWSGDNSERARSKASAELLDHVLKIEKQSRPYHLVGHSHGGSVVWGALRLAKLRREELDNLGSWTTVGTPFLHHRTRGAWNVATILQILIAVALFRPAFNAVRKLTTSAYVAMTGGEESLTIPSDADAGYVAVLRAPVLKLAELLGVKITEIENGFKLGSYIPGGDMSYGEYLFLSREGLTILGVTMLAVYVFVHLAATCISPVLESLRIRSEQRLERQAAKDYAGRWLGLWSPDDEAINGLRATLDFTASFVGRITPRERIFFSDNLSLIARPYYWLLAPVYNRVVRPSLDRFVRRRIIRTAQGNNRPSAEVVRVSPLPFADIDSPSPPPLPDSLNRALVRTADNNASDIAPKLRKLLGETRILAGLEAFSAALSGKELVHTSYFNHPEVLDLISANVYWGHGGETALRTMPREEQWLVDWFVNFKKSVDESDDEATPADVGRQVSAA